MDLAKTLSLPLFWYDRLKTLSGYRQPCTSYLCFSELFHPLLLVIIELLPTERVYEHGMLLEVLFERALLPQQVRILVVDEDLLVLEVVDGLVADVVHGVGVVQRVRRRLFPATAQVDKMPNLELKCNKARNFHERTQSIHFFVAKMRVVCTHSNSSFSKLQTYHI
jgi:hypothetical protein